MNGKVVGRLRKPVAPELLIESVRSVLNRGRHNGDFSWEADIGAGWRRLSGSEHRPRCNQSVMRFGGTNLCFGHKGFVFDLPDRQGRFISSYYR